jgi:Na+-transporting NADH:ubiquinone oxidoreductase subunit NqrE
MFASLLLSLIVFQVPVAISTGLMANDKYCQTSLVIFASGAGPGWVITACYCARLRAKARYACGELYATITILLFFEIV